MKKYIYVWLLAGAVSVYATAAAISHSSATGVVKQRMDAMVMLSNQIKLLSPMLLENKETDFNTFLVSAQIIAQHGGSSLSDLFPPDSIKGPSDALPEIWSRWQEFQSLSQDLKDLGRELEEAAKFALAGPQAPPQQEPTQQDQPAPQRQELSEWDRLDAGILLGISALGEPDIQNKPISVQVGQVESVQASQMQNDLPTIREVGAIYSDILKACSTCHTSFRRSK